MYHLNLRSVVKIIKTTLLLFYRENGLLLLATAHIRNITYSDFRIADLQHRKKSCMQTDKMSGTRRNRRLQLF
jgi:hypothetical protein